MQIVKSGGAATLVMQDYLEVLRDRYYRTRRLSTRTAGISLSRHQPIGTPDVLRYLRNGDVQQVCRSQISHVRKPDGTLSQSVEDIESVFRGYFEQLFSSEIQESSDSFHASLRAFIPSFPQDPEEFKHSRKRLSLRCGPLLTE